MQAKQQFVEDYDADQPPLPPLTAAIDREIAALDHHLYDHPSEIPSILARVTSLERVSCEIGYLRGGAWAMAFRAACFRVEGHFPEAAAEWNAALGPAGKLGDRMLEAHCLHGLGVIARLQQEYERSFDYLLREMTLRYELGDIPGEQSVYNSLALSHAHLGNYAGALDCYRNALRLAQSLGDLPGETLIRTNLGGLMIQLGDGVGAVTELLRCRAMAESNQMGGSRVGLRIRLCEAYTLLGQFEQAKTEIGAAFDLIAASGTPARLVRAWNAWSGLQIATGEYAAAEDGLRRALEHCEVTVELLSRPFILQRLGVVSLRLGKREEALHWYEAGLDFARESAVPRFLSLFHNALAEYYREAHDFEGALSHYEAYHQAEEAMQRQFAAIQLAVWNAQAALEKAEAERDAARREAERERIRGVILEEANRRLEQANQENVRLLAELEKHTAALAHQANRDPLTGLFNRRYLDGALEREVNRVKDEFAPLALAIADLDNFKHVNDHFSHQVGDVVLKTTARLFARCAREGDILARYGGEEFVLALPGATAEEAKHLCNRVRRAIAAYPWYEIHPALAVTVSMGICSEPVSSAAEALAVADRRLYQAKRDGKNRVCHE